MLTSEIIPTFTANAYVQYVAIIGVALCFGVIYAFFMTDSFKQLNDNIANWKTRIFGSETTSTNNVLKSDEIIDGESEYESEYENQETRPEQLLPF